MSTHLSRAERARICDSLLAAGPDAPTLCEGWATRDLAAHLVIRERRPDLAAGMFVGPLRSRLEREQKKLAHSDWRALVNTIRTGPPVWNPMRIGAIDKVANTSEFVIHHEDVLRGDGRPGPRRTLSAEQDAAVWDQLTSAGRLMFRKCAVPVELKTPDGRQFTAHRGEVAGVSIVGTPLELLMVASGRGQVAEVEWQGDADAIESVKSANLGLA